MAECAFCRFYKERNKVIFENGHFFARFDDYPVSSGHAHVVLKRHAVSFSDLTNEEWAQLKPALSEVIKIIEKTNPKRPDGYNIGLNEGVAAGRTIDHFHIHIIPRYSGDVKNPEGGIRNVIPGKGKYR